MPLLQKISNAFFMKSVRRIFCLLLYKGGFDFRLIVLKLAVVYWVAHHNSFELGEILELPN